MRVRMRGVVSLAPVVVLWLVSAAAASAQEVRQEFTLTHDVAEARLWFLARDRAGTSVPGLTASQASVLDEGLPVQRPLRLTFESDAPVRLHFVIDVSGSDERSVGLVQAALAQFVAAHSHPGDTVWATAFSGQSVSARLASAQDVAAFWKRASTLIGKPVTAIYDNLFSVLEDVTGCDAILLISDGADNWSAHHSLPEVLVAAQHAPARIFTLDIGTGRSPAAQDVLARIAAAGGGRMVAARTLSDADAAISGIAQGLRTYYTLSFPIGDEQRDGRFHAVSLQISDERVARIQMKAGYLAPARSVSLVAAAR